MITVNPMWSIIAKNLSRNAIYKLENGTVNATGKRSIKASANPWPSPNIIGSNIPNFTGFERKLLNINLKPSSKIPAEKAIKIPTNKGFNL